MFAGDLLHAGGPNLYDTERWVLHFNSQSSAQSVFEDDFQLHIGTLQEYLCGGKSQEQLVSIAQHCISLDYDEDEDDLFLEMCYGQLIKNQKKKYLSIKLKEKKLYLQDQENTIEIKEMA